MESTKNNKNTVWLVIRYLIFFILLLIISQDMNTPDDVYLFRGLSTLIIGIPGLAVITIINIVLIVKFTSRNYISDDNRLNKANLVTIMCPVIMSRLVTLLILTILTLYYDITIISHSALTAILMPLLIIFLSKFFKINGNVNKSTMWMAIVFSVIISLIPVYHLLLDAITCIVAVIPTIIIINMNKIDKANESSKMKSIIFVIVLIIYISVTIFLSTVSIDKIGNEIKEKNSITSISDYKYCIRTYKTSDKLYYIASNDKRCYDYDYDGEIKYDALFSVDLKSGSIKHIINRVYMVYSFNNTSKIVFTHHDEGQLYLYDNENVKKIAETSVSEAIWSSSENHYNYYDNKLYFKPTFQTYSYIDLSNNKIENIDDLKLEKIIATYNEYVLYSGPDGLLIRNFKTNQNSNVSYNSVYYDDGILQTDKYVYIISDKDGDTSIKTPVLTKLDITTGKEEIKDIAINEDRFPIVYKIIGIYNNKFYFVSYDSLYVLDLSTMRYEALLEGVFDEYFFAQQYDDTSDNISYEILGNLEIYNGKIYYSEYNENFDEDKYEYITSSTIKEFDLETKSERVITNSSRRIIPMVKSNNRLYYVEINEDDYGINFKNIGIN